MRTEAEVRDALRHVEHAVQCHKEVLGKGHTTRFIEGLQEVLTWVLDEEGNGDFTFGGYLDRLRNVAVRHETF